MAVTQPGPEGGPGESAPLPTGVNAAPAGDPLARLAAARQRIDALDAELVRVAAARLAAAADAGAAKAAMGQSLVDFARERDVLAQVRFAAATHGLDPAVAEDLVTRLILASTTRQETERIAAGRPGSGRHAVVVGGAGRMGRWLANFLRSSGYATHILDPAQPETREDAERRLPKADLVLVATPPHVAARLYAQWALAPPAGVVADVCSVKGPLAPALRALLAAGGRVASFHPMFGPGATVLRGADVVLCRGGHAEAEQLVRGLFAATSARLVEVGIDEHDVLMADVLSLAHASAIAFAASLPSGPAARSTTYRRLHDVAAAVVQESPQVYYEIQAGNPHSLPAIDRLAANLARLRASVAAQDAAAFAALLDDGRQRVGAA